MSFWNKVKGFLGFTTTKTTPTSNVDKVELNKGAVDEAIDIAVEGAEITLDKFEETKPSKPKRARTKKGKYVADDKSTPDINEAWVGGKAPKKKTKK
jgi:hypothetical protein